MKLRILLLAPALSGCLATTTILGTPRTIGRGQAQAVPAIGYQSQGAYGSSTLFTASGATATYANQQAPVFEVVGRKGITDNLDLGLRLFTFGIGGELKLALVQTPIDQSGVDLAFAPQAAVNFQSSSATLPVLIGYTTPAATSWCSARARWSPTLSRSAATPSCG